MGKDCLGVGDAAEVEHGAHRSLAFIPFIRGCLPVVFSLAALHAQSDLATITGVVTDAAQAVVPDVSISVRNVETNIARNIQTNQEGYFTITNLPPGSYELTAEKAGFRAWRETGLVLITR